MAFAVVVVAVAFAVAVVVVAVVAFVEASTDAALNHYHLARGTFGFRCILVIWVVFVVVVVVVVVSVVVFVVGFVVILGVGFACVGSFWRIWEKDSFPEKSWLVVSCETQPFWGFHRDNNRVKFHSYLKLSLSLVSLSLSLSLVSLAVALLLVLSL